MASALKDFRKQVLRVAQARSELYADFPRLYRAFDYCDMIVEDGIPTMGVAPQVDKNFKFTGYHDFYWNPKFVDELSDKQLKGILLHELLHVVLEHTTARRPEIKGKFLDSQGKQLVKEEEDQVKQMAWNQACDVAINQLLRDFLQDPTSKMKGGLFPESFNPPLKPDQNAEFYYKQILKDMQDQLAAGKKLADLAKKMLDDHGQWMQGNGKGKASQEEIEKIKKQIAESGEKHQGSDNTDTSKGDGVQNEGEGSGEGDEEGEEGGEGKDGKKKSAGQISKDLEKIRGQVGLGGQAAGTSNATSSKVNLQADKERKTPGWLAQTKTVSTHGYDILPLSTRKVPNRRFGMIFPGKRRRQVGNKILVAVDVSGSIDMKLYNLFTSHLYNLQRLADFDIVFFNHALLAVDGRTSIDPNNAADGNGCITKFKKGMQVPIGGGTSFEPVITLFNLMRRKYDALLIFTDGEASYNTPPVRPREVNWIVYNYHEDYVKRNMPHGNIHFMDRNNPENAE